MTKNKTDQSGTSSEPNRRMSNFPRAMLASLCLVVIATGIGVLFIKRPAPSPVAQREAASSPTATSSPAASSAEPGSAGASAVAGPRNTQEVKPSGPALVIPRLAGKGAGNSIAGSRARAELPGSRVQRGSAITATELRQRARKGIGQLFTCAASRRQTRLWQPKVFSAPRLCGHRPGEELSSQSSANRTQPASKRPLNLERLNRDQRKIPPAKAQQEAIGTKFR
jgi:hypothetical protein